MEWDWTWSNVTEDRRTSCSRSQLADARFSCRQSERKKNSLEQIPIYQI